MVVTLVERGGRVRSKHVAAINSKTLRPFIMKNVSRKSTLNTDEAAYYDDPKIVAVDHASKLGREFANHHAVDHSRKAGNISATESPTISASSGAPIFGFYLAAVYIYIFIHSKYRIYWSNKCGCNEL
jgi:hypothetical protein